MEEEDRPDPGGREDWRMGDFSVLANGSVIVGELLCEELGIHAREHVLDVATGSGNAALSAARRRAAVTAVDFVPELVVRARERAAAERLRLQLALVRAESLPFGDATFDVVLSTFGVMFAHDPELAASEMLRACRPGGRIGITAWTPDGTFARLLEVTKGYAPPGPGTHSPTRWGTLDGVRAWFGLPPAAVRHSRRDLWVRADSPDSFVDGYLRYYGPFRRVHDALAPDQRPAYREGLLHAVREANQARDGTLFAPLAYLEVTFTRE